MKPTQSDKLAGNVWRCPKCKGLTRDIEPDGSHRVTCFSCGALRPGGFMTLASPAADPCQHTAQPAATPPAKPRDVPEADTMREVERWLEQRGYLRMTAHCAEEAKAMRGCRGWFGHWTDNERNPLISDHLILSGDMRRCLLIEYKSKKHKWEAGQRELCDMGCWRLAMDAEAAKELVTTWEET